MKTHIIDKTPAFRIPLVSGDYYMPWGGVSADEAKHRTIAI
ncbi:MAG: hypothetical protein VB078_08390 [Clostridiaceae bacterium]|nr:hypothetical protein [Clostridiaceae bacterium]